MHIQRKALIKWTKITLICGAHSFFWGTITQASILAMLLGLATLILMFSAIESHPMYQAKHASNNVLATALDWGIRIRLYAAVWIALSYIAVTLFNNDGPRITGPLTLLIYPYMGELSIGASALDATRILTGIDLYGRGVAQSTSSLEHFIGTYSTTVITGLIHTLILAALCLLMYGGLWARNKYRRKS